MGHGHAPIGRFDAVTSQGDDGAPVSTEVGVVRFGMRSGGVFLQFICGHCARLVHVGKTPMWFALSEDRPLFASLAHLCTGATCAAPKASLSKARWRLAFLIPSDHRPAPKRAVLGADELVVKNFGYFPLHWPKAAKRAAQDFSISRGRRMP